MKGRQRTLRLFLMIWHWCHSSLILSIIFGMAPGMIFNDKISKDINDITKMPE
jgi:hypothetical protein